MCETRRRAVACLLTLMPVATEESETQKTVTKQRNTKHWLPSLMSVCLGLVPSALLCISVSN